MNWTSDPAQHPDVPTQDSTRNLRPPASAPVGVSMALGLAMLGVTFLGSGCADTVSSTNVSGVSPNGSAQSVAPRVALGDLPPSLSLTGEQKQAMESALDDLNAARQRRHETGKRGAERRGRGAGPGAGWGFGGGDPGAGPPFLTFLEESAEILEPEQFEILAEHLAANADVWQPGRRDGERRGPGEKWGHGPGRGPDGGPECGPGPGHGFRQERGFGAHRGEALGLDAEQREKMRDTMRSFREDMRGLVRSVETGERAAEAALDEGTDRVEKMEADLAAILTPEQFAKMEERRQNRFTDRMEKRLEGRLGDLDERLTRRATFLDRALGLDDAQAEQVRGFLLATVPQREALPEEMETGALDPHLLALRMLQIEQTVLEQIRGVLNPEQLERFETLQDLLPRGSGRGMRG